MKNENESQKPIYIVQSLIKTNERTNEEMLAKRYDAWCRRRVSKLHLFRHYSMFKVTQNYAADI